MNKIIFLFCFCCSAQYCSNGELFFKISNFSSDTTWHLKFEKIPSETYWRLNIVNGKREFENYVPPDFIFTRNSGDPVIIQADASYDNSGNGTLDDNENRFVVYYGKFNVTITEGEITESFTINYTDCDYYTYLYSTPDLYFKFNHSNNEFIWTNSEYNQDNGDFTNNDFRIWDHIKNSGIQNISCIPVDITVRNLVNGSDYGYLNVNGLQINSGDITPIHLGQNNFSTYTDLISGNKFRNWNSDNINYDNPAIINIIQETNEIDALFFPTFPLKVIYNIEGGSGSSNYQLFWQDANIMYHPITGSANSFYCFDYNPVHDQYSLTTLSTFNQLNTTWNFINWDDGSQNLQRIDEKITAPKTYTAYYKGIQHSDNINSFSSNNQRKVLKTSSDGSLFKVYESMGSIWMEKSKDNGTSWVFYPNVPLFSKPSSAPSLDHFNISTSEDYIFVIYENSGRIKGCVISDLNPDNRSDFVLSYFSNPPVTPVISCFDENKIMALWNGIDENGHSGLVYNIGTFSNNPLGIIWYFETEKLLDSSKINSINPALASLNNYPYLHLAWEENNAIKYCYLTVNINNDVTVHNYRTPSDNKGFTYNNKPSIIAVNGGARLTWISSRTIFINPCQDDDGNIDPNCHEAMIDIDEQKAFFVDPSNQTQSWSFSDNVQSVNINQTSNPNPSLNNVYSIAWGRDNSLPIQYTDCHTLAEITTLSNICGKDVQITSGFSYLDMMAIAFNTSSLPYNFNNQWLYPGIRDAPEGELEKATQNSINNGREGVIRKDSAQFFFAVGDVKCDNTNIEFIHIADTTRLNSIEEMNDYLVTNPIQVNDNSNLYYSVQYGISDSAKALNAMKGNEVINFKVEILDAATNEVINVSDNISFDSTHVYRYNNISYQMATNGIGNRSTKLRLNISSNANVGYSLNNRYSTGDVLQKRSFKHLVKKNFIPVYTFALSQNYPNPFNPTTTIRYQIPKPGIVTLKVYDILGREVATLVNENKVPGNYDHTFNASKFPSGVYIYSIKVNDYIASKKMILLK